MNYDWFNGISSAITIIANLVVIVSIIQVRNSTRTLKLEVFKKVENYMLVMPSEDIYFTFPKEIVLRADQMFFKPPKRHRSVGYTELELRKRKLTQEQLQALESLSEEQIKKAKKCINGLNDIMNMIEMKIISYDDVFSAYHAQILRLLHVIEPVRRKIEHLNSSSIGGNYGHRLLRLYHQAYCYNGMYEKHSSVDLLVIIGPENNGKRESYNIIPRRDDLKICAGLKRMYYRICYERVKRFY